MADIEEQVEAEYRREFASGDRPAVVYFGIGYRAMIERELAKAVNALSKATALEPENSMYPQIMGIAYANAGENVLAVECFRKCIELHCHGIAIEIPEENPYFHLGWCLEDLGCLDEAEESFKESIKRVPAHFDSYHRLGMLLQCRIKFEQAAEVFRLGLDFCSGYNPQLLDKLILKDMKFNLERALQSRGYEEYMPTAEEKSKDAQLVGIIGPAQQGSE